MPYNTGNVVKLIVDYDLYGEPAQNQFHFRCLADNTEPTTLVTAFKTNCEALLAACLSEDNAIKAYRVEDKIPGTGFTHQAPQVPVIDGTVASGNETTSTAVVISWYGTQRGRGNRGRSYMPAVPESFRSNGTLTAPGLAAYNAFAAALIDHFDNAGGTADPNWLYVVWRQHLAGSTHPPFNPEAGAMPITSHVVRTILRDQRRRQIATRIGRRPSTP